MAASHLSLIGLASCALLAFAALTAPATVAAQSTTPITVNGVTTQFAQCQQLTGAFTAQLCWNVSLAQNTLTCALTGPTTVNGGWLGLGFSNDGSMPGSQAVIGWRTADGTVSRIDGFSLPDYYSAKQVSTTLGLTAMDVGTSTNGLTTTLLFTRNLTLASGATNIQIQDQIANQLIVARGTVSGSQSTNAGTVFLSANQHAGNDHNQVSVIFRAATAASTTGGGSSTASASSASGSATGGSASTSTATSASSTGKSLTIGGVTTAFAQCSSAFAQQFELCWNTDSVASTITIAVSSVPVATGGWIGIGFSPSGQMVGSSAIIGWQGSGSNQKVGNYELQDKYGTNPEGTRLQATDLRVSSNSDGRTYLVFTRPLTTTASQFTIDPQVSRTLILARGPAPSSPSAAIPAHALSASVQGASIVFATGSATGGSEDSKDKYRKAHAALMAISWGFFLPIGILIARFFKGYRNAWWFNLHRAFNMFGLSLALAGWIIALVKFDLDDVHRDLGMAVMILALLQPINAVFRPHPPKAGERVSTQRYLWALVHANLGRAVFIMAIVNCYLGMALTQLDTATRYKVVFSVFWIAIVVLGLVFELRSHFVKEPPFTQLFGAAPQSAAGGKKTDNQVSSKTGGDASSADASNLAPGAKDLESQQQQGLTSNQGGALPSSAANGVMPFVATPDSPANRDNHSPVDPKHVHTQV